MTLATIRTAGATRAVKVDGSTLVDLGAADLGEFLAAAGWRDRAAAASAAASGAVTYPVTADYAPLVPRPSKVVCVANARKPSRFLVGGETVTASIEGIGQTVNRVVKEVTS